MLRSVERPPQRSRTLVHYSDAALLASHMDRGAAIPRHVAIIMDGKGRVLLPDYILEMDRIQKEIMLLGSLNKWELWNPEVLGKYISDNSPSLESLAQEINFSAIFNSNE